MNWELDNYFMDGKTMNPVNTTGYLDSEVNAVGWLEGYRRDKDLMLSNKARNKRIKCRNGNGLKSLVNILLADEAQTH